MAQHEHVLETTFKQHGFLLTPFQVSQFERYRTELLQWNTHINLTAITDTEEILHKHFLDSLNVLTYISLKSGDSVIDIGTGAGFPGVVLKIYVPGIRLTLVEASKKKGSFLKFLIVQLSLDRKAGVEVLTERAEVCARAPDRVGTYDWVFTRYVAGLRDSAAYCMPFLKPAGRWVAYKSARKSLSGEITGMETDLQPLNGNVEAIYPMPKTDRRYVVVRRGDS